MKGSVIADETSTVDQNLRESVIQDHLTLMRRYFDLLYTKNLDSVLEFVDDDIEWLIVPTGDVIRGKVAFADLATNHWGASPDRIKKLLNLFAAEDYACMEYISAAHSPAKSTSALSRSRRLAGRTRSNAASSSTSKITRSTAFTSTSTWTP